MSEPQSSAKAKGAPSILPLMALIAGSAVSVMIALALTLHSPVWVICVASTTPIFLVLLILREMVKLLTYGEDDEDEEPMPEGVRKPGRTSW